MMKSTLITGTYVFLDKNESSINPNSLKKRKISKVKNNRCVQNIIDF